MKQISRVVSPIGRVLNVIAGISLMGIVVVVTLNTITRRTPLGPILGTYEIAGYLGGIVIAFTLAVNQLRKVNIAVDMLVVRFSRRTQAIISSLVYLISAVLFSGVFWALLAYAGRLRQSHEVSLTLHVTYVPEVYAVSLCFALLALVLLTDFVESLNEARKP